MARGFSRGHLIRYNLFFLIVQKALRVLKNFNIGALAQGHRKWMGGGDMSPLSFS